MLSKQDILNRLGPLTEVNIKIRLPKALIDYINEVEVEQHMLLSPKGLITYIYPLLLDRIIIQVRI